MVLILFGNGVVAMDVLFNKGGYTNITIACGLAVTLAFISPEKPPART